MSVLKRIVPAWDRFWFQEVPTSTIALIRIVFGLVMLAWAVSLAPDVMPFFASDGFASGGAGPGAPPNLFQLSTAPAFVAIAYVLFVVATVLLTVGLFTRAASAFVFVCLLSFTTHNPFVFNAGDGLLRVLSLYVLLSPAGDALSLDSARRGTAWTFECRPVVTLRLIQIQLCLVYLAAFAERLNGTTWLTGDAVSYALRIGDIRRFPVPEFATSTSWLVSIFTYGTMAVELLLPALIWNRRLRPWVMGCGCLLHLSIEYSLLVGFFGAAVLVGYLAFIPPDTLVPLLHKARASRQRQQRRIRAHSA